MAKKSGDPIDVHVGARVRLRRMELGHSQEWLGDRLGLTFQQVQKYEKGANRIGASRLYRIATILETSVASFFFGLSQAGGGKDMATEFFASRHAINLAKHFTALNEGVQRAVVAVCEEAAK